MVWINWLYIRYIELENFNFKIEFRLFLAQKLRKQAKIKLNPGYGNTSKQQWLNFLISEHCYYINSCKYHFLLKIFQLRREHAKSICYLHILLSWLEYLHSIMRSGWSPAENVSVKLVSFLWNSPVILLLLSHSSAKQES